jgi:hypothetical protein
MASAIARDRRAAVGIKPESTSEDAFMQSQAMGSAEP